MCFQISFGLKNTTANNFKGIGNVRSFSTTLYFQKHLEREFFSLCFPSRICNALTNGGGTGGSFAGQRC